ncbi:hypothetical protein LSH36_109g00019, partial [Paralvinella palmiformis]
HKNWSKQKLDTFVTNGFLPTITKPTRFKHTTTTLIDNIYISAKRRSNLHSAILTIDILDHLPVITNVGCHIYIINNTPKIIHYIYHIVLCLFVCIERIYACCKIKYCIIT